MKFLIKNIPNFMKKKLYYKKCEKWPRFWKFDKIKLRRMGIKREMGIKGKGDARAYKSKELKSFGYTNNIIIITKVKN